MPADRQTRANWIGVALWLAALAGVITGELLPGNSAPMLFLARAGINDKLMHFAAYTLLAVIPVFAFRLRTGLVCAVSMIALGVALEFAQRLVPGRGYEVADMLANTLGVLAGVSAALLARAFAVFTRSS
jgi:VanZ family protein